MKKNYQAMTKKELLKIAKLHGIKGRHKMSKEKLINAILTKKKPLDEIRKFEETLKNKELPKKYGENHVELLPKEAGTVYVHWEIKDSSKQHILKLTESKNSILTIPVVSNEGSGYMRVEEGKSLKAVIGIETKKGFRKILESEEIFVPVSKPSKNKTAKWVKVNLKGKKTNIVDKKSKETEALKEKKKKTEETAKTVKYIRIPKEK